MSAQENDAARSATGKATGPDGLGDPSDFGFLYGLIRAPCFRETALYSIGGGAALGALHFHRNRNATKSAETMVKAGCGFALIHWVACRKRYYDEREATYGALKGIQKRNEQVVKGRLEEAKKRRKEEEENKSIN